MCFFPSPLHKHSVFVCFSFWHKNENKVHFCFTLHFSDYQWSWASLLVLVYPFRILFLRLAFSYNLSLFLFPLSCWFAWFPCIWQILILWLQSLMLQNSSIKPLTLILYVMSFIPKKVLVLMQANNASVNKTIIIFLVIGKMNLPVENHMESKRCWDLQSK